MTTVAAFWEEIRRGGGGGGWTDGWMDEKGNRAQARTLNLMI